MTASTSWVLVPATTPQPIELTAEQAAAVAHQTGVQVVLGGPGTGKTSTLVAAVLERLRGGGSLDRLVVLTASRQAAQEVRRQVIWRFGGAEVGARITTVHGFALGVLRELGDPDQDLRLLRAPEQEQRLRDLLEGESEHRWPVEVRAAATTRGFARQLREVLARARQLGLDPEQVIELAHGDPVFEAVGRFFEVYLTIADFDGALDYTELVHRARLLLADPAVGKSVRARFDAVFVDDAQELDQVSANLMVDLARLGLPVMAYGDPQQRLGSFRGASAQSLRWLRALPEATTHTLSQGFRNQQAVADALGHVRARLDATDAPPVPSPALGTNSEVMVRIFDDGASEVAQVAAELRVAVTRDGCEWGDLAVMVRSGRSQLTPLARALGARGIPVEVTGDELALGSQRAVQALLAALVAAPRRAGLDASEAAELLAGPLGGLDALGQRRLARLIRPAEVLADPDRGAELPGPEAAAAAALGRLLAEVDHQLAAGGPVAEALWRLWDGTAWPSRLREAALAGTRSAHQDLDAVVELFELADRHSELAGAHGAITFRAEVAREEIPADTGRELAVQGRGVRLLTAHRARTGTWRRVYLVGVSAGLWPVTGWRGLVLDPDRLAPDHLDAATTSGLLAAERRLFYVACSRATEQLHVSAPAATDEEPAQPSRFLWELGVAPERIVGRPVGRQTAAALVAELREVAADETQLPALRRAAALRLAMLGEVITSQGFPAFRDARPENWWGVREPSSPAWRSPRPIVITGSGLQQLLACPRQWFLTRRGGADRPRGSQASVGELIHLIAQRAAAEELDLDQMLVLLEEGWEQLSFETRSQRSTEKSQATAALTRYLAWHRHNPARLLGVEVDFEANLEVSGVPVILRGTVDRLELGEAGLAIVDLKTGRHPVKKAELVEHEQLGVYQLAAALGAFDHLAPGAMVAEPSLLHLRSGTSLPLQQFQPVLGSSPTWLDQKLSEAVTILDSDQFEAREGRSCGWCPVRDSCPALHPDKEHR